MHKTGRYKHFKGKEYELLFIARDSETCEQVAVYRALYDGGECWVRPLSMWEESVEYNGKTVARFEYLGE